MTWFEKRTPRNTNQEREALAASVEDVVAEEKLVADRWSEEYEPLVPVEQQPTSNTAIISPRLRLQSRPIPSVYVTQNQQVPPAHFLDRTTTSPVEVIHTSQQEQRLAGRSTKVRLQAVHVGQEQEASTERLATIEKVAPVTQAGVATVQPVSSVQPGYLPENLRLPGGRGLLKQGQSQLTVANGAVTECSVVMVMLAGNPGPVVVQYILLHPGMGFTLHLSAPTAAPTPFNYVIWLF